MDWFTRLVQALPGIRNQIQLTGLVIGVAAFVAVRFAAPDAVVAQISAGAIGVLFIIFGQVLQPIIMNGIPSESRVKFIITLFILFVFFILSLVGMILYSLPKSITNDGNTVTGGTPDPVEFRNWIYDKEGGINKIWNVTIFFNQNCDETVLSALVQPNQTGGKDMKDYLEKLQERIQKKNGTRVNYSVEKHGDKSYEIICQ